MSCKTQVAVVIPTLNEEDSLKRLFTEYQDMWLDLWELGYKITFIVVDDSDDEGRTARLAEMYGATVLSDIERMGYGTSLRRGLSYALNNLNAERIVEMDADHPILYLIEILKTLENHDIVIGWEQGEWAKDRKITKWICDKFLKMNIEHPTCGYIGFRKEVLESMPWNKLKAGWDVAHLEFIYWSLRQGYSLYSFPFEGQHGERDYSWKRRIIWLWDFLMLNLERLHY